MKKISGLLKRPNKKDFETSIDFVEAYAKWFEDVIDIEPGINPTITLYEGVRSDLEHPILIQAFIWYLLRDDRKGTAMDILKYFTEDFSKSFLY